ncbi:M48 family metalloprotease [Pengzhenrongella sp.]|jgi:Zn-dependent protease with chaperone function|uniref:M48 family metalloprotease n=1 Tax=Pengzhenrongella sp. TaxID=2888820 RepID=UPI002F94F8F2
MTTDGERPSAAREWALIAGLNLAAHPLGILIVVGVLGAAAYFDAWGFLAAPLALGAFGALGRLTADQHLPGRGILPDDEPQLAALVRDVAERLELRVPILVRVIPTPDAVLAPTKVAGVRVLVLLLGLPLLRRLTVAQLAAVVAHELAHEPHLERRTSWLGRARAALVESLDRRIHVPAALAGPLLRATQQQSWQLETSADLVAANVAGTAATRGALEQIASLDVVFSNLGELWALTLAEAGEYPDDLFDAIETALADPFVARQAAADRILETPDPFALESHPPLLIRLAAVPERSRGPWDPTAPIRLRDAEVLDRWCVRELLLPKDSADEQLRPVRVLDCAPERFGASADEAFEALRTATGRPSRQEALAAALDAIADGGWARLAQAIEPEIGSAPRALRAAASREVFVGCLGRAVSGRLLDAGWVRASRWLTQVVVDPDGVQVDARELISSAIDGADPTRLRSLLALPIEPRTTT